MHKNYLYSVTDKALFDALSTSKITNSDLRDLFLNRGVIISTDTPRKELAKNFSKYNHDYYDHQKIANSMGAIKHKEKSTMKTYNTELNKDHLEKALDELKKNITADDDLCIWHETVEGNMVIDITYLTTDYTKSEFKQLVKKDATILIEKTSDGYNVRYPANPQVEKYESSIRKSLEKEAELIDGSFSFDEVNLSAVDDPALRTNFFELLIKNMEGYKFIDVTDIYVFHPKPTKEEKTKSGESGIHISRASLKGEGVLLSGELQELFLRGFYISKVKWQFEEELIGSDIYDAEVMFGEPENFTNFLYITRGKYKYKEKGAYNKNPSKLDPEEELKINRLIEKTAINTANTILSSVVLEDDNESSENEIISD